MNSNIKKDHGKANYYNKLHNQDQNFLEAPTFANQAASALQTPYDTPGKREGNFDSNLKSSYNRPDHDSSMISEHYFDEKSAMRKKQDEQNSMYDDFMDFERESDRPLRASARADAPQKKSKGIKGFFKNSLNKFKKKKKPAK